MTFGSINEQICKRRVSIIFVGRYKTFPSGQLARKIRKIIYGDQSGIIVKEMVNFELDRRK